MLSLPAAARAPAARLRAGAPRAASGAASAGAGLTHIDAARNQPRMVDVGGKARTRRTALARSIVRLPRSVAQLFEASGAQELRSAKGPVLTTAIIAGVQAAKRTSELIPFCHPLPLDKVDVRAWLEDAERGLLHIECEAACEHRTGVEMEALTGASVAALTVYDMLKALSHDIVIEETRLLAKTGGKSDYAHRPASA
jgi:cyclic pyranopterin phosphate synthase